MENVAASTEATELLYFLQEISPILEDGREAGRGFMGAPC